MCYVNIASCIDDDTTMGILLKHYVFFKMTKSYGGSELSTASFLIGCRHCSPRVMLSK